MTNAHAKLQFRYSFRQNFNLEALDVDPNLGFDGGVLEISVDQGQTYHDIIDAGGSFLLGAITAQISTDRGSPIVIEGRLRWRMASDTSGSSEGWRADTVNITWCQGPPCTPTSDSKCHIQAYANCDAYSYSYTYEYAQRYANCNSYCYVNSYPYSYGQAYADCPASRNTETTPDSAAAPESVITGSVVNFRTGRGHPRGYNLSRSSITF